MGTLIYGASVEYEMDDRTLAHLRAVVISRLRSRQSCSVTWDVGAASGSGRVCLWISEGIPLEFRFRHAERVPLNPRWIRALADSANTPAGLLLISEAEAEAQAEPAQATA